MITATLVKIFRRDLNKLKVEIDAYQNESNLWLSNDTISNSAGNLVLHIVGNLKHYIGTNLGNTDYVRQRDLEFTLKHVPKSELFLQIDTTIEIVQTVLQNLTETDLQKPYKRPVKEDDMTTGYFLVHLCMHLGYHLGQINYHRRLLDA